MLPSALAAACVTAPTVLELPVDSVEGFLVSVPIIAFPRSTNCCFLAWSSALADEVSEAPPASVPIPPTPLSVLPDADCISMDWICEARELLLEDEPRSQGGPPLLPSLFAAATAAATLTLDSRLRTPSLVEATTIDYTR